LKVRKILSDSRISLNDASHFPFHINPKVIDAILLSHPHLDHSGSLTLLFMSRASPSACTTMLSMAIVGYLISDFMKLSERYLPYEEHELYEVLKNSVSGMSM